MVVGFLILPLSEREQMIAITVSDCKKWGCPHCGYRSGYSNINACGYTSVICGECKNNYDVLNHDLTKSKICFSDGKETVYPELQEHPRSGVPSHGNSDKQAENGEFFSSRGIGIERGLGCYVCGSENQSTNMAAYVRCKESGQRIVLLLKQGAKLDWRKWEPDYVQVKVGACNIHVECLNKLNELVGDGVINLKRIEESKT